MIFLYFISSLCNCLIMIMVSFLLLKMYDIRRRSEGGWAAGFIGYDAMFICPLIF
jgi:hypothetical protein